MRIGVRASSKDLIRLIPVGVQTGHNGTDARSRIAEPHGVHVKPSSEEFDGLGRFHREFDGRTLPGLKLIVRRGKRAQPLNQQGKDVSILFVEGYGLPFDRREYLSVLREMRSSVNVMRILDEVRGHLATEFEVHLRFAQTIRRYGRDRKQARAMPKIRERNEEAPVFVKNNLERFDPELSRAYRAYNSLGTYRIDVFCSVSLRCATVTAF